MINYKIIKKGVFESHKKFEEKLNGLTLQGWRAISLSHQGAQMVVLMEKQQGMAAKKAFALRLDPELLKAVEKWAADEFRSTNGQLEWIISNALKKNGRIKGSELGSDLTKKKPDS